MFKTQIFGLAAGLGALAVGSGPAQGAYSTPHILNVALTGSGRTYSATITGLNFGAAPVGIPCTACTPYQLQIADVTTQKGQTLNVTSWSDTSVTVSGIVAARGDMLGIGLYNQVKGLVAPWVGRVSPAPPGAPRIASISFSGSGQGLTITVDGTGFGPAPSVVGQTGLSPYFQTLDFNGQAPNTTGFPWYAGFCGTNFCSSVPVGYTSWSNTQVVISGFGTGYGTNDQVVNGNDTICIAIWPSTSTSGGTTGGTAKCSRIPAGD
jgi:hypothetical protein